MLWILWKILFAFESDDLFGCLIGRDQFYAVGDFRASLRDWWLVGLVGTVAYETHDLKIRSAVSRRQISARFKYVRQSRIFISQIIALLGLGKLRHNHYHANLIAECRKDLNVVTPVIAGV